MLVKFLYMTQDHLGIDFGFHWQRQAAGPFDTLVYQMEKRAAAGRLFTVESRMRGGVHYIAGPCLASAVDDARRVLGDRYASARALLTHFRTLNTEGAELLATVYAAWNDLLIDGRPSDDDAIVAEVRGWHEAKKRFAPSRIKTWIGWLRLNSVTPRGTGVRTRPLSDAAPSESDKCRRHARV